MSEKNQPVPDVTFIYEPDEPALELEVCVDNADRIFQLAPELRPIQEALEKTGTPFEVSVVATVYFYPAREDEDEGEGDD